MSLFRKSDDLVNSLLMKKCGTHALVANITLFLFETSVIIVDDDDCL